MDKDYAYSGEDVLIKAELSLVAQKEKELSKLAKIASISGKFARDMSEKTNRPVLFLANARNGTLLYYGVEDWKQQLTEDKRKRFVDEVRDNENWPHSKHIAYFETAQNWLDSGRISWFVYPTMEVKIASLSYSNQIMYFPKGLEDLIKEGVNVILADISKADYPGSFFGFKEDIETISVDYHIIMASRINGDDAFDDMLENKIEGGKNVCVMINPLGRFDIDVYYFVNNKHALLGWRGIKFGNGHGLGWVNESRFNPVGEYVRKRILEMINAQREGD